MKDELTAFVQHIFENYINSDNIIKLNYKCPKGMFVPDSFKCGDTPEAAKKNYEKYQKEKMGGKKAAPEKKISKKATKDTVKKGTPKSTLEQFHNEFSDFTKNADAYKNLNKKEELKQATENARVVKTDINKTTAVKSIDEYKMKQKQNSEYVEPIELKLNYKCPYGMFVPESFMCGETKAEADSNYKKYKEQSDDRAPIKKDTDLSGMSSLSFVPAIRNWRYIISYMEGKGVTILTYREGSEYDYATQRAKHPDAILIDYTQNDVAKTMDIAYKFAKKEMEKEGGIKGFSDIEGLGTAISKKDLKADIKAFYDAMVGYDLKEWKVKKTSEQHIIALAIVDMQSESLGIRSSRLKEKAPTLYKYLAKSLKAGKFGELATIIGFGKEYADTGVRLRDQPIAQNLVFDAAGFKSFEPLEKEGEKVSEFGVGKSNLYVDVDEKNGKLIITRALLGQGTDLFDSEETIGKYLAASMLMKTRQGKTEDIIKDASVVDNIYENIESSMIIDSRQKKMWMEYKDRLNDTGRRNAFLVELAYREPKLFKSEFPEAFEKVRSAIESNKCGNDVRNILGGALAGVKTHQDIIREKKEKADKIESSLPDVDKNIIDIIKSDKNIIASMSYDTSIDAMGRCARNADDDKKSDIQINEYYVKNSKPGEIAATAVHEYTHALMTNVIGDNPRKPDYLNFREMSKFFGINSMDSEFEKKLNIVKSDVLKEVVTNDLQKTVNGVTETFIKESEENKRWYDSVVYGSELRGDGTAYVTVNNGLYHKNYSPAQLLDNIDKIDIPEYSEKNDVNNKLLLMGIAQAVHRNHNAATEAKQIYETELVDTAIQMRGSIVAGRSVDWVSAKKSARDGYDEVVKSKKYGMFDTEIERNIEKKLYDLPFEKRSAYLLYDSIKNNKGKAISLKFLDDKVTIFDADSAMKSHLDKTDLSEEEKSDITKFTHGSWVKSIEGNVPVATSADSEWIKMPSERIATFAEALWFAPEQTEKLAPKATAAFRNMVKSGKLGNAAKDIWKVK